MLAAPPVTNLLNRDFVSAWVLLADLQEGVAAAAGLPAHIQDTLLRLARVLLRVVHNNVCKSPPSLLPFPSAYEFPVTCVVLDPNGHVLAHRNINNNIYLPVSLPLPAEK